MKDPVSTWPERQMTLFGSFFFVVSARAAEVRNEKERTAIAAARTIFSIPNLSLIIIREGPSPSASVCFQRCRFNFKSTKMAKIDDETAKILNRIDEEERMNRTEPQKCTSMTDVREGVDRLDSEIISLLGERFRYMDAAARIKPHRDAVRDETRKTQVIENARRYAIEAGVPDTVIADLYERLVEASIAYEFDRYDETRG